MPQTPTAPPRKEAENYAQHKADACRAFLENHYASVSANIGKERQVVREKKPSFDDFHIHKCIGRGAFGEVFVCQYKNDTSGPLYALKRLRIFEMIDKNQITHVRSEKDVLAEAAATNPWVVHLYKVFHDPTYLYMLMEYMPGGDMISWLCEKGMFDLESTRFYIAELCAAVSSVHAMGFVHRDIKPDNILLGTDGHIKLSDFGLSKRFVEKRGALQNYAESRSGGGAADGSALMGRHPETDVIHTGNNDAGGSQHGSRSSNFHQRERAQFMSLVGSPGYIAPEILRHEVYTINCDWWSVGVIMYEMLYGIPPFYSQDPLTTCRKIKNWPQHLHFPVRDGIPDVAVDFMKRLICDPPGRMTYEEMQQHPFLRDFSGHNLRAMQAPYKPDLAWSLDTKYFPPIEIRQVMQSSSEEQRVREVDPRGILFADFGFTYSDQKAGVKK